MLYPMTPNCPICLDPLRVPVSLPCGHIFCEECLTSHITVGAASTSTTSSCPTCRTMFPVSPDIEFMPSEYQQFLYPAVRRIYLDGPCVAQPIDNPSDSEDTTSLLARIARLEAKVAELKHDKGKLKEISLRHTMYSNVCSEGQRLAKIESAKAKKETMEISSKYEALKARYWRLHAQTYSPDGQVQHKHDAAVHLRTISNRPKSNVLRRSTPGKLRLSHWRELVSKP